MQSRIICTFWVFQTGVSAADEHTLVLISFRKIQKLPHALVPGNLRSYRLDVSKGGVITGGIGGGWCFVHVRMGEGVVDKAEMRFVGRYCCHQAILPVCGKRHYFRIDHRPGAVECKIQLESPGQWMCGAEISLLAHRIGNIAAVQPIGIGRMIIFEGGIP